MERYRDIHPDITPRVVADSAWGSVILLEWATEHGVRVTFSMSTKVWGWLPQSLAFGTPLESGRIAYIPELKSLYSLYTTKNEKGEERREKTLRSEKRRVGKEGVSTCRSRWSPNHKKKKKK